MRTVVPRQCSSPWRKAQLFMEDGRAICSNTFRWRSPSGGRLFLLPESCTLISFSCKGSDCIIVAGREVIDMYPYQYGQQRITTVNGRNGAEMYQLAPNSSVLLLDESAPLVWVKQTDGAGYPTLTPYSITPYEPEKPVDLKGLEERIARLEETLNEQSDTSETKRKPARTGKADD